MDMGAFATTIMTAIITSLLTMGTGLFLARKRMEREFKLQFQTETVIHQLLSHPRWRLRTFKTLKHHLGGFEDDELRKMLLQSGAIRFEDSEGIEVWGLLEKNHDLLDAEVGTASN